MIKEAKTQLVFGKGIFLKTSTFNFTGIFACLFIFFPGALTAKFSKTAVDLYPVKSQIKYAKGFSITYYGTYKVVNVINYYHNQKDTLQYL